MQTLSTQITDKTEMSLYLDNLSIYDLLGAAILLEATLSYGKYKPKLSKRRVVDIGKVLMHDAMTT